MTTTAVIRCLSCAHEPFETYRELALHILSSKRGHFKGRSWAAKYISINSLSPGKRRPERRSNPAQEEDSLKRASTQRMLSGETELVRTLCLKCKRPVNQLLPMEYTSSADAWRIKGFLVAFCHVCRT